MIGRMALKAQRRKECMHVLTLHSPSVDAFSRIDAGKVELDGSTYAGFSLPFDITQLIWIEVLAVGGAEFYRNGELDSERRIYPGERAAPCMHVHVQDACMHTLVRSMHAHPTHFPVLPP